MNSGCVKNQQDRSSGPNNSKQTGLSVAAAKNWFDGGAEKLASKGKLKDFIPLWDKALTGEDSLWFMIEVPLRFDKTPGFIIGNDLPQTTDQSAIRGQTSLLIRKNKINQEIESVLVHIVPDLADKETKFNYLKKNNTYSGYIFLTDMNGEFASGSLYKKGKVIGIAAGEKPVTQAARAPVPEGCTENETRWYERYCTGYDDGSTDCTEWGYIGSTYTVYCEPQGGGGSGTTCTTQELEEQINGFGGGPLAENILIGTTNQWIENGQELRKRSYKWKFHKSTFLTYSWNFYSFEEGVHQKIGTSWYWKTLSHVKIAKEGTGPIKVECKNLTATPYISPGATYADMSLHYEIEAEISCLGITGTASDTYPSWKGWQVGETSEM